jgi:hypothetical protein
MAIPEEMLNLLAPADQGVVCVCQSCIALYSKDKAEFLQYFGFAKKCFTVIAT